jgi:hypothetical protein
MQLVYLPWDLGQYNNNQDELYLMLAKSDIDTNTWFTCLGTLGSTTVTRINPI